MSVASAIHASAAILLVVAGVSKLCRPSSSSLIGIIGMPARNGLVRLVGGAEAAAGVAALLLGGPAALAVGLLYVAFAAVVLRALLADAESCGCFGHFDAPPSPVHILGNLVLAAVSFAAAGASNPPVQAIMQTVGDSPAVGAALAVETMLLAGLALVAFTALPEALGARRSGRGDAGLFGALPAPAGRQAAPGGAGGRR